MQTNQAKINRISILINTIMCYNNIMNVQIPQKVASPEQLAVYIDWDWTLGDTTRNIDHLSAMIAEASGVHLEQVVIDVNTNPSPLGGYDFEGHMRSYELDPEPMWRKLEDLFKETDYLYPDSVSFMTELIDDGFQPRILSFGEKRYQRAKIMPKLAQLGDGRLGTIPVFTTMERKREFLELNHPHETGVLVDDKPDQHLPANFVEINFRPELPSSRPTAENPAFVVASLHEAGKVIRSLVA